MSCEHMRSIRPSMKRWNDRVALVTGASQGIGAAICKELVKHNMTVVGCARRVEKIMDLSTEEEVLRGPGKIVAIRCDLESESDILRMFDQIRERFKRVDVCINNAAYSTPSSLSSGDTKEWRNMMEVNVIGLCICTRESLKLMREKNIEDGQIIHIGSILGHKLPVHPWGVERPCFGVYNGTKFMIWSLAEALRHELRDLKSSIKVATISPGVVNTENVLDRVGSEFSAAQFYAGESVDHDDIKETCLQFNDITDAIIFILSRPEHVNVEDVIVQPVDYAA